MKALILIRGVPGAGKSTLAKLLSENGKYPHFEADQFFVDESGDYNFDPSLLHIAHSVCQKNALDAMKSGVEKVIVSNTSISEQHLSVYQEFANELGYHFFSVVVENRNDTKSIHGVPETVRKNMAEQLMKNLKFI
jgi:predicted kinase